MFTKKLNTFFTPLEQFAGLNTNENLGQTIFGMFFCFDVAVYKMLFLIVACFVIIFYNSIIDILYSIIPVKLQTFLYILNKIVLQTFGFSFVKIYKQMFYPMINILFFWIIFLNAVGLIPLQYSLLTYPKEIFSLGFTFFFIIVIYSIARNGLKFFSLLSPGGTPLNLLFLITPIETLSNSVRPISLSLRLFANIIAGQIFIKIILGTCWSINNLTSYILLEPIYVIMLCFLLLLESVVVILQAFVFSALITLYISEMIFFE